MVGNVLNLFSKSFNKMNSGGGYKKATAIIYTPFYLDKWVHLFAYQPSRNHSTLGFVASTFPKAHSGLGEVPFLDY
jgi:hypothetical protein